MRILLANFVVFFSLSSLLAQDSIVDKEVKVNQQFWIDYNFHSPLNEIKGLNTQVGFRKIEPEVYNKYLIHSSLYFKNQKSPKFLGLKKPFIDTYHLGAGAIYTQNYNADDNFELRLMQGLKFHIPTIKALTFHNYVRLEERFQNNLNGSGWTPGMRLRYRLSTELAWGNLFKFTHGFYFPISGEVFVNLKKSDRYNDLLRISPGMGYRTNNNWKFELYLIFNRTKNITETNQKSSDFILRLRIINDSKKKYTDPSDVSLPIDED
ncbi:DUF2490 domain-containing protein [Aequorivita sp. SDUM287046]|uniref:DUF2490 domain-containing protein n=1 Tax=Aequorivita aurantiaca TaxID=3053356 RepID=A0ABT8DI40_9FLAO|nr:DUF2490 domain-containing protein [Aequorivita aurantiaca]MDN3723565.1 DUF2490 domain-containing protein [Aequorivita aurantiaca]